MRSGIRRLEKYSPSQNLAVPNECRRHRLYGVRKRRDYFSSKINDDDQKPSAIVIIIDSLEDDDIFFKITASGRMGWLKNHSPQML
jgi:hypothetical protein